MRYLTKEWYLACQTRPMTQAVQKKLDDISKAYRTAIETNGLPDELNRSFSFHDGIIQEIISGTDHAFRIDCPFSEYHTVIFRSAMLKQEQPPVGAVWLYQELYRHKSGTGYEAHILFYAPAKTAQRRISASDLIDTKIICSGIDFA